MPGQADVIYLYDGSFDGLLCCVFDSVYRRELPQDIQVAAQAQPTLFDTRYVDTDSDRAERVRASIPRKISAEAAQLVRDVFCSCVPRREMKILRFLNLGYKIGPRALYLLGHADVQPMLAARQFLKNETHHFIEFLRFSDCGGVLTAVISPKAFVLPYLQGHFCERYAVETFLIYDRTHRAALIWKDRRARMVPVEDFRPPKPDADERQYRALWQRFYNTIAIPARENPRCRMNHCPKRYWPDMLEMPGHAQELWTRETTCLPEGGAAHKERGSNTF